MINLNKKDSLTSKVEEILHQEALKGNQKKIDKNHNNKIDADDFKILRGEKKKPEVKEEIDVNDRSVDDLGGRKDTTKKDDVGPSSKFKPTKVRFHAGPKNEEAEIEVKKITDESPPTVVKTQKPEPRSVEDLKAKEGRGKQGMKEEIDSDLLEALGLKHKLKAAGKKILSTLGHGSDEDLRKDLQKKVGVPQTGKKPTSEEVEQIDELSKDTLNSYVKKSFSDKEKGNLDTPQRQKGLRKATSRLYKEDEESLDEVKMADLPVRKVQGKAYGASKPEPHWSAGLKGPKDAELKNIEAEKKKKKFSEMLELYNEKGIKSLSEMLAREEASEEEFNKEVADAKAKNDGKKKNVIE